MFVLHGALWLRLKTDGELAARLAGWVPKLWLGFVVLYAAATAWSVAAAPHLFAGLLGKPLFWGLVVVLVGAIAAVPRYSRAGRALPAFLASATVIVAMIGLAAVSLFPRLVPSSLGLEHSLTVYNAASTPRTLTVMLVIALAGMPLVLGYTAVVYRIFRGKVAAGGGYH